MEKNDYESYEMSLSDEIELLSDEIELLEDLGLIQKVEL